MTRSTDDTDTTSPPRPEMRVSQICVVVRDMEEALARYTDLCGWGPWKVFELKPPLLHDTTIDGEPAEFSMIDAETTVGGVDFELIQPLSGDSVYQRWLDHHGEGVQHIACMQHSFDDSDAMKDYWAAKGVRPVMSGRIGDTIEFYYLDTGPLLKVMLESGSGHAIDLEPTYVYP